MSLRVAGAFGGGMGRMGETCGALAGAFMAIGLRYGKTRPEDDQSRDKGYALVRETAERFKARHGSTTCRDLLGADVSTAEGYKKAAGDKLFVTICPRFVRGAVEILEEVLGDRQEPTLHQANIQAAREEAE